MINRESLETFLDKATQVGTSREIHEALVRFMLRCLTLIRPLLPEIGLKAFGTAERFWLKKEGSAEDLLAARMACWNYLDKKGGGVEIGGQTDAAIRAVICVLYAEPDTDDFSTETVRWFVTMMDRIGDYSSQSAPLMRV